MQDLSKSYDQRVFLRLFYFSIQCHSFVCYRIILSAGVLKGMPFAAFRVLDKQFRHHIIKSLWVKDKRELVSMWTTFASQEGFECGSFDEILKKIDVEAEDLRKRHSRTETGRFDFEEDPLKNVEVLMISG